jgi:hypothetical protein
MRLGEYSLLIEDWTEGKPDPEDAEIAETGIVLTTAEFRKFVRWGTEVAG